MNSPEENDPIERLLREQDTHIADDGFTARVMNALPPRRRPWLHTTVLLAAAGIGSILAVRWLPWQDLPALDPSLLISLDARVLAAWLPVIVVVAALSRAFTAAFQQED